MDIALQKRLSRPLRRLPASVLEAVSLPGILFAAAVGIYLFAVLFHNSDFPIYFFTDEAVHMNEAADLLLHGFQNSQHEFLPTYFNIGTMFSLNGLSVYLQVIPYLLFGKSVAVTRGVSGVITALGAIATGLTLKNAFQMRHYWLGPLLLIASPAWFLNARTAFEYAELAAFYAIFLYCYLQYRSGKPRYIYAAVVAGAAAFYTHGLGQVLIGVSVLVLFFVDLRFHVRKENRRQLLYAVGLTALLAVPYLRYQVANPDVIAGEISQRGSYLVDTSLTPAQKIGRFGQEYFYGLNPLYWYLPNNHDLVRHVMKGYGHIWIGTLPFALLGLIAAFQKLVDGRYRALIVALLASPVPASIVGVGILRELWFMVPVAILTALGLNAAIQWLRSRTPGAGSFVPMLVFAALSGFTLLMLRDAIVNGPTWFQDYTLYGMQYGAKQVFGETVLSGLREDPKARYVISPNWANGTDQLLFFFIPPEYRDRAVIDTVDAYMSDKKEIAADTVFVALPDEYERAKASALFSTVRVLGTIPDPNGKPGFYLLRLAYADNVDAVFARMEAERRQPVKGQVVVEGDPATITYSRIESGQPSDLFDGKLNTFVRGLEANPFTIDLTFQQPLEMSSLTGNFGHMNFTLKVSLYPNPNGTPIEFKVSEIAQPGDPQAQVNFGASYQVRRVHIEVNNLDYPPGEPAKIHIWELRFNP